MNWEPIETAPRDGTAIIVQWKGHENTAEMMNMVWWDEYAKAPYKWRQMEGDLAMHENAFSHWMPLPEPPEKTP